MDLKDFDRFVIFAFPRFANSDRWFSPQAPNIKECPNGQNQRSTCEAEVEWKENERIIPHDIQANRLLTYGKI